MSATLHLMEPYRSALLSMGYDEGLISIDGDGASHSKDLQIGRSPSLREDVLQLLVLFEDTSIAWTETSTATEFARFRDQMLHKHATGLETAGVAQLLRDPEIEKEAENALRGARSLSDVWRPFADDIATFAPLIARQLSARGKPISEQLIRFAVTTRCGDSDSAWEQAQKLPREDREAAREIERETPAAMARYDLPIFSELHQCVFAAKQATERGSTIAGPGIGRSVSATQGTREIVEAAHRLLAVVIEVLLLHNLTLPLPRNLQEAVELRHRPGSVEFRAVFFPWLIELLEADATQEARLRREVVRMLKAARWAPRVRSLSGFVKYVGIAGELASLANASPPGMGLIVTAVSGGAERLAAKFESRSNWLLCTTASAD